MDADALAGMEQPAADAGAMGAVVTVKQTERDGDWCGQRVSAAGARHGEEHMACLWRDMS